MHFKLIFVSALFSTLFGCAGGLRQDPGYLVAQSTVVQTQKPVVEAEVIQSPRYKAIRPAIKSVAVIAPTHCEDKSASAVTGTAASQGTTVGTRCGVEMAELERALVRQGFNVMSWNMMNNRVTGKDGKVASDSASIAKRNGAQVLFQVNSLERIGVKPALDARIESEYFVSDSQGKVIRPASISQVRVDTLKSNLKYNSQDLIKNSALPGAMLDLNAVDAETGQAIWFYRGTMSDASSRDSVKNTLFWCYSDTNCYVTAPDMPTPQKGKTVEGPEVLDITMKAQPASKIDLIYFELLRAVTADFAKKFYSGE